MAQEKTRDEVRREFLDYVWASIDFWDRSDTDCREKLEGITHSLLVLLDGCAGELPAVDLVVRPHPDDKTFLEDEGSDWYPDGVEFGGALHEQLYRHPWPTNTAPVRGDT